MVKPIAFFLLGIIFNNCVSAYTFHKKGKCNISDFECQNAYYKSVIQEAAESGIPELDIPILDPFVVKNMELSVMGLIKVNILEGTVEGLKTCFSKNFKMDFKEKTSFVEYICEVINLEGKYSLETTDTLKALIGGINVHGKGLASVKIENIQINAEIPFEMKKFEDSEIHSIFDRKRITYTFEVLGKASITADNLYIGSQEISTLAVNIFNENWKFFTNFFGKLIIDVGVEVFTENANKFLAAVPLKEIISDDLSGYLTQ